MDAQLKRFAQAVRREVRAHVKREREPPALSLWVSDGMNPRRVGVVPVGGAVDAGGVAANIRQAVLVAESSPCWVAVGRGLVAPEVDVDGKRLGVVPIAEFAVVACSLVESVTYTTSIRAGVVGAWVKEGVDAGELVPLLQAALRARAAQEADRLAEKFETDRRLARAIEDREEG